MLDARLIKSKLWVGNPGPGIFFTVILLLCLFLNSIFKKFPGYFQCAAKIENPVLGDSGHRPVWKPLFLCIHQDCFFSLNVLHPESTFCLFPLLLFFLSFHFVQKKKRKKILLLALYLKRDFNNNINLRCEVCCSYLEFTQKSSYFTFRYMCFLKEKKILSPNFTTHYTEYLNQICHKTEHMCY